MVRRHPIADIKIHGDTEDDMGSFTTFDKYQEALSSELSANTRIAYAKGWRRFVEYCREEGIDEPLAAEPEQVAQFFVQLATQPSPESGAMLSMGTVLLYKSAVTKQYLEAAKLSPTHHPLVRSTMKGLVRLRGSSGRAVDALRERHVEAMLQACPSTLLGQRDAAIIAVGFAAALRRSEICNLTVNDVEVIEDDAGRRMWITIRRSKTDQEGRGQKVAILAGRRICPIERLQLWLERSGITEGHLFQTMKRGGHLRGRAMHNSDVPRILKHYAELIGLDPKNIAGHSLRAGFVTSAAVHHARMDKIMEVTRHKNVGMVMRYIRDADSFTDHAGQGFL